MARTAVLGFPRIGAERELKIALEDHWAGRTSADELEAAARGLRAAHLADRAATPGSTCCPSATSRSTTTCSTPPSWSGDPGAGATAAARRYFAAPRRRRRRGRSR